MAQTVEVSKEEFAAIRTGRAHPAMLNKISASYYGTPTPIQQLASFQVPEARTMLVAPYDQSALAAIERAIRDSDLGVNPSNDGHVIRIVLPQLTEERRKEYTKLARAKAEEGRIAVRNARRHAVDACKKLEKDKQVGEDDVTRAEKKLDEVTKKHIEAIDDLLKRKEAELMEI
ncbi:MAG: ribosome recycling factor [Propionibacteriaceae bacterium]|jgi:ribosome recycling factor|nr:ribosome recycling factor [Propionibacteriaceae bacterium]